MGPSAMSAYPSTQAAGARQGLPDVYSKNKAGVNVGYQQQLMGGQQ